MSAFALFCVIIGLLMIATRAPLVVAPVATREAITRMIGSEQRIRSFGVMVVLLGALTLWITGSAAGVVAQVIWYIGIYMVAAGALFLVPFPTKALALAHKIWYAFSPMAMRVMGVLAVALGAWLAWYGFSL